MTFEERVLTECQDERWLVLLVSRMPGRVYQDTAPEQTSLVETILYLSTFEELSPLF